LPEARRRFGRRPTAHADDQRSRAAAEDFCIDRNVQGAGEDDATRLRAVAAVSDEAWIVDSDRGTTHEHGIVLDAGAVRELESRMRAQWSPHSREADPTVERLREVQVHAGTVS
jgi:hypothetical protein